MSWIAVAAMILASSSYSYDDKPETIQAHKQIEFESYHSMPWRLAGIMER